MVRKFFYLILLTVNSLPALSEDLTIGWIGALTGDSAVIGNDSLAAVQTAVKQLNSTGGINGRQIRLVVQDDGYQPPRTLSAYEAVKKSINSRVVFVSTYGAIFALGKRPEHDGILILDTLDCNDSIVRVSRNHLCLATRTESIADNFLKAIGKGRPVAVLYEEEAWFQFIVSQMERALGKDLHQEVVAAKSGDYRSALARLKSAGVKHLVLLGNDAMGLAVKQGADLNFTPQLYSIASIMSPGFQSLAGANLLEGATISHWDAGTSESAQKFRADFATTAGRPIILEFVAAPSFDGATAVLTALRSLADGTALTAADLRSAIVDAPPFSGISGTIDFDQDGAVRSIVERLFEIRNGALQEQGRVTP